MSPQQNYFLFWKRIWSSTNTFINLIQIRFINVLINVFLVFILYHMSLDFLFENMCKTCVYLHFKIEFFFKICAQNIWIFKLRACINVHVIFPSILMLNTQKITWSAYNCNKSLNIMNFNFFLKWTKNET